LSEELVVADTAILIDIEDAKEEVRFLWSDLDAIILDSLHELLIVNKAVVVVIDDLEDTFEVKNAAGTSLSHPVSELLEDLLVGAASAALCTVLLLDVDLLPARGPCDASRLHLLGCHGSEVVVGCRIPILCRVHLARAEGRCLGRVCFDVSVS
jgi:hypothetical protein